MKRLVLLAWAAQLCCCRTANDQDVLASIDVRLRALELARLDFSLEHLVRRMDGVEAKLVLQKDEFARRMEGLSEKVSAKASHLELKLERMDSKLDLLDRDLHGSVEDLLERMVKGEERCESLDIRRDEKVDGMLDKVREAMGQMSNRSLKATEGRLMSSLMDNQAEMGRIRDNLTVALDRVVSRHEAKFREMDAHTRKVVHGIQELLRTTDELRAELTQEMRARDAMRDEFRRLQEQISPLSALGEEAARQVAELSATVDASFATLLVAQNAFIDSCRRVQHEETHVYTVLQQVVYEMRNRSVEDVRRIGDQLRTQGAEFNRSLARVVKALHLTSNCSYHDMGCTQNKSSDVLLYEDTEALHDYDDYLSDYPDAA